MGIPVKLEAFEGPLDLLLHLIEKNKIDIYDIPIVEITEQYMEYIRQMQEENLNIMSEFMVMAATLLDIKCKMLLPKEVTEEGEEKDPREELVQQLLEYKMYKYMSYELRDRMADASRCVYRAESMPKEVLEYRLPVDIQELIGDLTLAKLQNIFNSIIKRQENKVDPIRSKFGKIEKSSPGTVFIQLQKTLGQFFQTFCLEDNDIEIFFLQFHRDCAVRHGLRVTLDGGQRGTEIVGDIGDEFSLVILQGI